VELRQLCSGLRPVLSSFGSSRQLLVEHPEPSFMSTQSSWCLDPLSRGEDSEVLNSTIDPNHCLSFAAVGIGPLGFIDFDLDGEVPVTGTLREASRENLARKSQLLSGTNPAKFRKFDSLVIESEGAPFDGEGWLVPLLALESRVADLTGALLHSTEEVGECRAEVGESLVGHGPRQLNHPRKLDALDGIQFPIEINPGWLFTGIVLSLPAVEAPVERSARCTRTPLEKRRLDVVEVEADALAEDQTPISLRSRRRMISLIETSSRFASSRSHARSGGSRWMSSRWTLTRFRGLTMPENVHDTRHGVKWQPRRSLVNSRNRYEILGELKVRWRACYGRERPKALAGSHHR